MVLSADNIVVASVGETEQLVSVPEEELEPKHNIF